MNRKILNIVIAGSGLALLAQADVNVQLFRPSMSPSYTLMEDTLIDGISDTLQFGAMYNYVNRPIVEMSEDRKERLGDLVTAMSTVNITGGYYWGDRVFTGVDLPVNMVAMNGQGQKFAMGDTRLMTKVRLTERRAPVAFSLIPEVYLPTGDSGLFLSDGKPGAGLKAAVEREFGRVKASANVGYRFTPGGVYRDIDYRRRLSAGLGTSIRITRIWSANAEASGTMVLPRDPNQNPGELYTGVRYQPRKQIAITGGVGFGAINGVGSTDYRAVVGLQLFAMPNEAPIVQAPAPAPVVVKAEPRVFFEKKQIRITEEVKFLHDSAVLADSGKNLLDEVAHVMKANLSNFKSVTIEGHTNSIGTHAYNMKLSDQRAAAVKEYLLSRGVPEEKLTTVGFGKTRPKQMANLSKKAQLEANRRVEFKVIDGVVDAAAVSGIQKTEPAIQKVNMEQAQPKASAPASN